MFPVDGIEWVYETQLNLEPLCIEYIDCFDGNTSYEFKAKNCELLQFTGLKDRNGTEIYQGDIVAGKPPHYIEEVKGVVEYGALAFAFKGKTKNGMVWFDTITNPKVTKACVKVIGNKFENPELLED